MGSDSSPLDTIEKPLLHSLVKALREVSRRNYDNALVLQETVHLDQELIEGLFQVVLIALAPLPTNGVQFVNENDAGCMAFRLLK